MISKFWNNFYKRPLEDIPWHNTQADWFKELIDSKVVSGKSALDLGCGTGAKSLYLVQEGGFEKVIGIDIASKAIAIAKEEASKTDGGENVEFICVDALEWLNKHKVDKFDLVLDWALLHGIPMKKHKQYAWAVTNAVNENGLLLIRTFSTGDEIEYFEEEIDGLKSKIYLLIKEYITQLYPNFKILRENKSQPSTKQKIFFLELLLKKQ